MKIKKSDKNVKMKCVRLQEWETNIKKAEKGKYYNILKEKKMCESRRVGVSIGIVRGGKWGQRSSRGDRGMYGNIDNMVREKVNIHIIMGYLLGKSRMVHGNKWWG